MAANIGSTIYTKLAFDSNVTGMVGTSPVRVFPDIAPLNVAQTFPYITYKVVSDVPTNTKGNLGSPPQPTALGPTYQRSPLDVMRVQVSIFDTNYSDCSLLAEYVRDALDRTIGSGYTVGIGPDIDSIIYDGFNTQYEKDIKPQGVYHFAQDYIVRVINTKFGPDWTNVFSIQYEGVDQYLDLGDQSVFSFGNGTTDSPFTMSMWVYFDELTSSAFFAKSTTLQKEYHALSDSSDQLRIRLYDDSTSAFIQTKLDSPTQFNVSQWYHVAFVYDGSSTDDGLTIYVDGAAPNQTRLTSGGVYTAMENTAAAFNIGRSEQNGMYMQGKIDEFTMFDEEKSSSQVQDIYNSGTPKNEYDTDGLIGYWRMGDVSVFPTIKDKSTNSNDATMTNMLSTNIENVVP